MGKKVLIVVAIPEFDYSNEKSAVASFLNEIYRAFEKNGDMVDFLESSNSKDEKVIIEPSKKSIVARIKHTLKIWNWLYQSLSFSQFFKKQVELINKYSKSKEYDLIIEFYTVGSKLGAELATLYNAQLSLIYDSPVDEQFLEMYGTKSIHWNKIKLAEKHTLEKANRILAYSPTCAEFILKKFNLKTEIAILPCVINKESVQNRPEAETFNIGFIGSFLSWHKVDLLVKAFNVFYQSYPSSRLQLIGFGKEWEGVRDLVTTLKLDSVVEMPGFVNEEVLLSYKKGFSVAVMPGSNWYGSPLKLFEYAQSGIPFIAPKTETVKSIFIENEHCFYIDNTNELNSLVELLNRMIINPLETVEMGKRLSDFYSKTYSKDVYSIKLLEALNI